MKKIIKILIGVVIAALFIGTLGFLYSKSKEKPVVFETLTPVKTNILKKTVATGSIVPRKEIEIKPQVSGIIEELYITEGQQVKKGQVLAKVKIIPDMLSLNNAESRVNRAKIALDEAKTNFQRQKKLYESQLIAHSEYLNFEVALKTAEEEYDASQVNLQLVRDGVSQRMGTATNTLIRSTIDGMVLEVPVEIGNSVIESNNFNAGTTIVSIADMGEMIFKGKVDESEVGKIHQGMNLILTIGAIEADKFEAELEHISPKGKEENGAIQFEIKAAVKLDEKHFIRAGYSATADIVLDKRDSVLAIQEALIFFENDSAFVEVETQPQVFEKRLIKTGLSDGINIEVLSGIDANTKIKKRI